MNLKTILTIIITAIIVGGGVYYFQNNFRIEPVNENKTTEITNEVKTDKPTLYKNDRFGISLEIPADWGDVNIISENPKDPGPPADGGMIVLPTEKITFTSTQNPKKEFVMNVYDTTLFKDYMAYADGSTGQTEVYSDERYFIDIWSTGVSHLIMCDMLANPEIPKEICDEVIDILHQINIKIIPSFKIEPNEPLSYSATDILVLKEIAPFDYSDEQLKGMAEECGTQYDNDYFDQLLLKFKDANKILYNFKYNGDSQQPDTFLVTLVPNKAGYTSMEQFKKDFDQCYAGGKAYPRMLNDSWLLFTSGCGTGFADGTGRVQGCTEAAKVVEPTLKLN